MHFRQCMQTLSLQRELTNFAGLRFTLILTECVTQAQHAAEFPWACRYAERDCCGPHARPFSGLIWPGQSFHARSSGTCRQITGIKSRVLIQCRLVRSILMMGPWQTPKGYA